MLHKKKGMPQEGEIVFCTVTNVQYHSVFAKLDEYENKSGMIHISEISPGRIRNINDYVKEGKVIVCKVLKINRERGHIDLSLRRVNESQRRLKVEERKQEAIAENIVNSYCEIDKKNKLNLEKEYNKLSEILLDTYSSIYSAFEDVVENDANLVEAGLDKDLVSKLEPIIRERIKPKEVEIGGTITIHSYESDGVTLISKLMKDALKISDLLDIRTLGAGNYSLKVNAPDYKEAEKILKKAVDLLEKGLKKTNTEVEFKRD